MPITILVLEEEIKEQCKELLSSTSIEVTTSSLDEVKWDTLGAPGNSVGWMKGGYDQYILNKFGDSIEREVRNNAPIAVGNSCTIDLGKHKRLVYTPTMEYPMPIVGTMNVFWAYLELFRWSGNIAAPLYGTGIGKLDVEEACRQLELAYNIAYNGASIDSFAEMETLLLTNR